MVESLEDYTTLLSLDYERDPIHVREVTPGDFYLAAALSDKGEDLTQLLVRLILNHDTLSQYNARETRIFLEWISENEISGTIMDIETWMSVSLGLLKGRWSESLSWLESQPMSKIQMFSAASEKYFKPKK
jgi:hypothetical protein